MKAYALVVLSLLILFSFACEEKKQPQDPDPPQPIANCDWDSKISNETAKEIQKNWSKKWDFPASSPYAQYNGTVPDSFFINSFALQTLAIAHCGFRVYYGLTEKGDMRSMCLVITAINDHMGDILDGERKILFTNITQTEIRGDTVITPVKYIGLDEAKKYTSNWRCYNGVSRDNDEIGNVKCDVDRVMPARGRYKKNKPQLIPLGNAFDSDSVFVKIEDSGMPPNAYVFYNSLYKYNDKNKKGLRQDLYIRGYGRTIAKGMNSFGPIEIVGVGPGGEAIDITGGCPVHCNIEDALQAD